MLLLTKVLSQLAYPLLASLLLAVLAGILLWRNDRRRGGILLTVALGWLWLWSTPVFSDWVRGTLEQRYPAVLIEQLPTADVIVLLGGAIVGAKPPKRLYADLDSKADRIWHAMRLFRAGKAPRILISGGKDPWSSIPASEAELMAEFLQEWGIPQTALVLEARSRTTEENRDYSLSILRELGAQRILLVTSALHMPRALQLFKATGLIVIPAPTDFEVIDRRYSSPLRWLPDALALSDSSRAFKEYLGRWVNELTQ